ncbi:unnamed protein product [Lota lota]
MTRPPGSELQANTASSCLAQSHLTDRLTIVRSHQPASWPSLGNGRAQMACTTTEGRTEGWAVRVGRRDILSFSPPILRFSTLFFESRASFEQRGRRGDILR